LKQMSRAILLLSGGIAVFLAAQCVKADLVGATLGPSERNLAEAPTPPIPRNSRMKVTLGSVTNIFAPSEDDSIAFGGPLTLSEVTSSPSPSSRPFVGSSGTCCFVVGVIECRVELAHP
jgi:hypothetical protein